MAVYPNPRTLHTDNCDPDMGCDEKCQTLLSPEAQDGAIYVLRLLATLRPELLSDAHYIAGALGIERRWAGL